MKTLTFEKEETITGITVYKVFFGVECLSRQEEVDSNALIGTDGNSVAYTNAKECYDECLTRYNAGYPKTTTLASTEIPSTL